MRHLAMTGIVTPCWIPSIMVGSLMRATPPSRRMSAGTPSRALTATAPASSAMRALAGGTTSQMTPPRGLPAGGVGGQFALGADCELHHLGRDGREDEQRDRRDAHEDPDAAVVAFVAAPTEDPEPQPDVGEQRHGADGDDRHG